MPWLFWFTFSRWAILHGSIVSWWTFGRLSCKKKFYEPIKAKLTNKQRFRLRKWKVQERYWYALNHIYGWSVPCIMTAIVAMRHRIKPSVGVSTCWFHRKTFSRINKTCSRYEFNWKAFSSRETSQLFLDLETLSVSFPIKSIHITDDKDQWTLVYLPISMMLALNVILCLWTSLSLMNSDFSPDTRKALRYK